MNRAEAIVKRITEEGEEPFDARDWLLNDTGQDEYALRNFITDSPAVATTVTAPGADEYYLEVEREDEQRRSFGPFSRDQVRLFYRKWLGFSYSRWIAGPEVANRDRLFSIFEGEPFDAQDWLLNPSIGSIKMRPGSYGARDYVDQANGSFIEVRTDYNQLHCNLVYDEKVHDNERAAIGMRLLKYVLNDAQQDRASFGKDTFVLTGRGFRDWLKEGESGRMWDLISDLEDEGFLRITDYSGMVAYAVLSCNRRVAEAEEESFDAQTWLEQGDAEQALKSMGYTPDGRYSWEKLLFRSDIETHYLVIYTSDDYNQRGIASVNYTVGSGLKYRAVWFGLIQAHRLREALPVLERAIMSLADTGVPEANVPVALTALVKDYV
jgi:hypothetical protein